MMPRTPYIGKSGLNKEHRCIDLMGHFDFGWTNDKISLTYKTIFLILGRWKSKILSLSIQLRLHPEFYEILLRKPRRLASGVSPQGNRMRGTRAKSGPSALELLPAKAIP